MKSKYILSILVLLSMFSYPALSAGNDTGLPKNTGLYGDPFEFFKTLPSQVQYLIIFILTFALLIFVVMFFVNIFGSASMAHMGAVSGNVGMRNTGTYGIMYGIGVVILVIIAVALFLYLF